LLNFERKPDYNERLPQAFLDWLKPLDKSITYNSQIVDKLAEEIGSKPETLSKWVYIGRDNLRHDRRMAQRQKMLDEGWSLLNESICQQAIDKGRKIELLGAIQSDWLTTKINGLYRPKKIEHGLYKGYFLIAPRKRNKGHWLGNLTEGGYRDCFCKIA
jgi:hypothetical protein